MRDPKDQFNAHIDAPAEQSVIVKQARVEGHGQGHGGDADVTNVTVSEAKNQEEMLESA